MTSSFVSFYCCMEGRAVEDEKNETIQLVSPVKANKPEILLENVVLKDINVLQKLKLKNNSEKNLLVNLATDLGSYLSFQLNNENFTTIEPQKSNDQLQLDEFNPVIIP